MSEARQVDLSWMPAASIEDWQRELDALCALRLMLAGLAVRHTVDPGSGQPSNEGLRYDIGAMQSALQQSIDRAAETVAAMRDLVRAIKGQPPAESAKQTVH